jgi:uncharacterized protein YjiS (DUF1127 family)
MKSENPISEKKLLELSDKALRELGLEVAHLLDLCDKHGVPVNREDLAKAQQLIGRLEQKTQDRLALMDQRLKSLSDAGQTEKLPRLAFKPKREKKTGYKR